VELSIFVRVIFYAAFSCCWWFLHDFTKANLMFHIELCRWIQVFDDACQIFPCHAWILLGKMLSILVRTFTWHVLWLCIMSSSGVNQKFVLSAMLKILILKRNVYKGGYMWYIHMGYLSDSVANSRITFFQNYFVVP